MQKPGGKRRAHLASGAASATIWTTRQVPTGLDEFGVVVASVWYGYDMAEVLHHAGSRIRCISSRNVDVWWHKVAASGTPRNFNDPIRLS